MLRSRIAAFAAIAVISAAAAIAQTTGDGTTAAEPKPYGHHDPIAHMKDMCIEHFARSAGHMAYLEAKLQLTPDQQPGWEKWRQSVASGAEKERADCLADVPAKGVQPTALDRDTHLERKMAVKVESLQAARPALEALYASLTPEQRSVFDRPMFRGGHEGWRHHRAPDAQPL